MLQVVILEQEQVLEVNMSITKKDIAKNITSKALLDNKTSKELLDSFIELVKFDGGSIQSLVSNSQYNILEDTLARRTYDESGDYTVRPFHITMKESTTLNEEIGVYDSGDTTDDNQVSSNALLVKSISAT